MTSSLETMNWLMEHVLARVDDKPEISTLADREDIEALFTCFHDMVAALRVGLAVVRELKSALPVTGHADPALIVQARKRELETLALINHTPSAPLTLGRHEGKPKRLRGNIMNSTTTRAPATSPGEGTHMTYATKEQQRAIHRRWRQANQELSYRAFRKLAVPVFAGDGAIAVPWCGMWLCIETDGYTHS